VKHRARSITVVLIWVLALLALGVYAQRNLKVSTDLRSFMPPAQTADQKLLMNQIGEGPGSRLLLLAITGTSPDNLAALDRGLADTLRRDPHFQQVVNGAIDTSAIESSLLPYRFLLSPTLDHDRYDATYLGSQLQQRLEDLGSSAGAMVEPLLPRDPTMEVLKLAELWTPPKSPALHDGVWFSKEGEALLLAQTKAPGFDPAAQGEAINSLKRAFESLPGSHGAHLTISGPGYFTVTVSARTRSEADLIGFASSVGFIILLLFAYRSVRVVGLVALPLLTGALTGITALTLGFGEAHGITLAFGFTLLGVAQEYPIRLLSHRRAGETALTSVRGLWPLLMTAIVSACIAYLAFFASGVGGLQQLAVFTITGLLAAGLATRYLLPMVLPTQFRDAADTPHLAQTWAWFDALPRPRWLPPALTVLAFLFLWMAPAPFWQNDLSALTPVSHTLLLREAHLRTALGAPDVRYLLVLQASKPDGVLGLSEAIGPRLDALVAKGAMDGVELPSRYLPSLQTQRSRQAKLPDRRALQAALSQALLNLPFRPDVFDPFVNDVEIARSLPPLTPAAFEASPLGARLQSMLVERDGHWLGLATLSGVHDPAAFAMLSTQTDGQVRLLDLKGASESLVVAYRTRIMRALLVAILLLAITVAVAFRDLRRAWHVLAPMSLATLLVLAVMRISGVEISLFHLVALTLAAGLGLHYALFFERVVSDEAEARRTLHATLVCVLSALLVFGLLALSSIPVLRAIGLTVSLGVAFHFTLSILMARERRE
jgi:predicted exporter